MRVSLTGSSWIHRYDRNFTHRSRRGLDEVAKNKDVGRVERTYGTNIALERKRRERNIQSS